MTVTIKYDEWETTVWQKRIEMPIIPKVGDILVRHEEKYKVKTREFDIDKDNITLYVG